MARAKIILGLLSLGAFSAALFACGGSDEPRASKQPLGVGDTAMANSKLEQAVRDTLHSHTELKAANLAVSADVTKNQVTISGTVGSESLREKAVELAKSAQVGVIVNDRILVKPGTSGPRVSARDKAVV